MKTSLGPWLSALAVIGMALPVGAADGPSKAKKAAVTDVALQAGGRLQGQVLTDTGHPAKNTSVKVFHGQAMIAKVTTDVNGRYKIDGLRNGLHTVRTLNGKALCRLWQQDSAPPQARKDLKIIRRDLIVRGQNDGLLTNVDGELLLGLSLFAGTAVAVGASIDNDDAAPVAAAPPASP